MAVNDIASWDLGLCLAVKKILRDTRILAQFNCAKIVDVYTFISSSAGWTPFGAHVDFEHSIIMGVSGSDRVIYTWPEGYDLGQLKSDASSFLGLSFDYESHIDSSNKVDLVSNDICVIKAMEGHIFEAKGPGIFLGLSCIESDQPLDLDTNCSALIPSKDSSIKNFLQENTKLKLRWSPSTTITSDGVENNDLFFQVDNNTRDLVGNFAAFIEEGEGADFASCLHHFNGDKSNVESLIYSCIRIGAVYIPSSSIG